MRWWFDWLVPFLLGAVPLLALIVVIDVLGWPPALIWLGIAFAITVSLLARERMHDHEAERELAFPVNEGDRLSVPLTIGLEVTPVGKRATGASAAAAMYAVMHYAASHPALPR